MAGRPFSPWRQIGDDAHSEPPVPITEDDPLYPLVGIGVFFQCALVYRELVKVGIAPPVVDRMELWQIAALMGERPGDRPDENEPMPPASMPGDVERSTSAPRRSPPPRPTGTLTGDALLEARVRAAREGRELDAEAIAGYTPDSMVAQFRQRAVDRRKQ